MSEGGAAPGQHTSYHDFTLASNLIYRPSFIYFDDVNNRFISLACCTRF